MLTVSARRAALLGVAARRLPQRLQFSSAAAAASGAAPGGEAAARWKPRQVPTGPYMDAQEGDNGVTAGLPPPPSSPAARSYCQQGINARKFAVQGSAGLSLEQARLSNVAVAALSEGEKKLRADEDDGVPAFFAGDSFSPEGQTLHAPPADVTAAAEVDGNGGNTQATSTPQRAHRPAHQFKSTPSKQPKVVGASRRKFSTAVTPSTDSSHIIEQVANTHTAGSIGLPPPPVTRNTPTSVLVDQVAAAQPTVPDFHPHPASSYQFSAPKAPHHQTASSGADAYQYTPDSSQPYQQSSSSTVDQAREEMNEEMESRAEERMEGTEYETREESQQQQQQKKQQRSPFGLPRLPDLSQLPQVFSMFESLIPTPENMRNMPKTLKKLSKNMPQLPLPPVDVTAVVQNAQKLVPDQVQQTLEQIGQGAQRLVPPEMQATLDKIAQGLGLPNPNRSSSASSRRASRPSKPSLLSEMLRTSHAGTIGSLAFLEGQLSVMKMQRGVGRVGKQAGQVVDRATKVVGVTLPIPGLNQDQKKKEEDPNSSQSDRDSSSATSATASSGDAQPFKVAAGEVNILDASGAAPITHPFDEDSQANAASSNSSDDQSEVSALLTRLRDQERAHSRTFSRLLPLYRVRPTALLPVWHAVGFALGGVSAMAGEKAALQAASVVEGVASSHYNDHLRTLNQSGFESDGELKRTMKAHRDAEEEHQALTRKGDLRDLPGGRIIHQAFQIAAQGAMELTRKI
jgi:ubiquinone biosynthesis monooxygenase Coq7